MGACARSNGFVNLKKADDGQSRTGIRTEKSAVRDLKR
jgi:hypothetical protein